jgi:hypothetical protein
MRMKLWNPSKKIYLNEFSNVVLDNTLTRLAPREYFRVD